MQCWKSINIDRQYGNQKIFFLSIMTMLVSFLAIFPFATLGYGATDFQDGHPLLFFGAIVLMYPLHKLLHGLPLVFVAKKLKLDFRHFAIKVNEPISKLLYLMALLTPFTVTSVLIFLFSAEFPEYFHYWSILFSINTGMSLTDFLKVKSVVASPFKSFIEESETGYEILVENNNN